MSCVLNCLILSDCCHLMGSSVRGIILARVLEWVAISSSKLHVFLPPVYPVVTAAKCCMFNKHLMIGFFKVLV